MNRPPSSTLRLFVPPLALAGVLAAGCGAQDIDAPPPRAEPQQCESLSALAPAFMDVLESGQAERLRTIIERNGLLEDQPDGSPSPVMTVLRVVVNTVNQFAHDPPEPAAPPNGLCAEEEAFAPAPEDANRMCEARRLIKTFVREGKGLDSLKLLDPFIAGILKYVLGQPPVATEPHMEVAAVISRICSRADCRTEDVLSLVEGILAFITPTAAESDRPQQVLAKLNALVNHPSMGTALDTINGSEQSDMILFSNLLLDIVASIPTEPDRFDVYYHREMEVKINDLLTQFGLTRDSEKYGELRAAIDEVLGAHEGNDAHDGERPLLYDMLDPRRASPILIPLQKVLHCARKSDPEYAAMKMVYDLGFRGGVIGLRDIVKAVNELAQLDERGTILNFAKVLLGALRKNEHGLASVRKLCAVSFSTETPPDGGPSNVELAAPVLASLFEEGAVGEILCVVDTLLYGCAGGQPACPQLAPATE